MRARSEIGIFQYSIGRMRGKEGKGERRKMGFMGEEQLKYVSTIRRIGEERMTIKRGGGGRRVAWTTRTSGGEELEATH